MKGFKVYVEEVENVEMEEYRGWFWDNYGSEVLDDWDEWFRDSHGYDVSEADVF